VLGPVYIFIIYQLALGFQKSKIKAEPYYKYFANGILAKMLGGVFLCLIYTQYYQGGDTTAYHQSSVSLYNMMFKSFKTYFSLFIIGENPAYYYLWFDSKTGFPEYWRDIQSWQVVRYTNIFESLGLRCYILSTILLAATAYTGIWRLFKLFMHYYPHLHKQLSLAILFVPSVLFWGSGILKDTYTLTCACWFTYCFHNVFILRKKVLQYSIIGGIAAIIIVKIKPYILLGLLPGAMIWFISSRLKRIKSPFLKFMVGPFLVVFSLGIASLGIRSLQSSLGNYSSLDKVLDKAVVTQKDLKADYNKGNSFDIGEFDASLSGVIKKFPIATFAGLFRPTIIDVRNPVMLLAAIENSIMLYLLLISLYRSGPRKIIRILRNEPLVLFSIVFSIFFAFSVGLTTSNFGALVRYKIPAVPFFASSLLIIQSLGNAEYLKDEEEEKDKKFKPKSINKIPKLAVKT
jgi:hypothetical protein